MAKKNKQAEVVATESAQLPTAGVISLIPPMRIIETEDTAKRGRYKAPSEGEVVSLAYDMFTNGQLQAIQVRKVAEDSYEPVYGWTRAEAGRMIVNGFRHGEQTLSNPEFLLKCEVVEIDDKTAKLRTTTENFKRTDLTLMDKVVEVVSLIEAGFKPKQIVEMTRLESSMVSRLRSLNELPEAAKDAIHEGKIGILIAVELAKDSNGFTAEEIESLVGRDELSHSDVIDYLRDREAAKIAAEAVTPNGEAKPVEGGSETVTPPGTVKTTKLGRTKADVVAICSAWANDTSEDTNTTGGKILKTILSAVVGYANGDSQMKDVNAFNQWMTNAVKTIDKAAKKK